MYFNYEVFSVYYPGMDNRGFSYMKAVYSKALKQGEEYKKMPIVTQINLIAGAGSKKPPKGLDKVVNIRTGTTRVNNLFIIDINLDIICDSCYNEDGRYNFFENFISVEEAERKIRNTYYTNGIEEGEERGKENALIETAKNLLKVGDSIQKISEVTGLSKQKIKSLQ